MNFFKNTLIFATGLAALWFSNYLNMTWRVVSKIIEIDPKYALLMMNELSILKTLSFLSIFGYAYAFLILLIYFVKFTGFVLDFNKSKEGW